MANEIEELSKKDLDRLDKLADKVASIYSPQGKEINYLRGHIKELVREIRRLRNLNSQKKPKRC